MNAVLIPFFLVARLAVDDGAWPYGPEYDFQVALNVTSVENNQSSPTVGLVANMICRPKGTDTLNCNMENTKRWHRDPSQAHGRDAEGHQMPPGPFNGGPFEIKFNNRGVEHLLISRDTERDDLNIIRSVSELLSIGADLNGKPDGVFYTTDNMTIGYCNASFNIHHNPIKEGQRRTRQRDYELDSLPPLNKVVSETIVIEKTALLKNCSNTAFDFFDAFEGTVDLKKLNASMANLKQHSSRIVISDVDIVSETTREGRIKMNSDVTLRQITHISLNNIRPAKEELPRVHKAAKTTILVNDEIEVEKVKPPSLGAF